MARPQQFPRTPVQIAANSNYLFALADDGSIWFAVPGGLDGSKWNPMPRLPPADR